MGALVLGVSESESGGPAGSAAGPLQGDRRCGRARAVVNVHDVERAAGRRSDRQRAVVADLRARADTARAVVGPGRRSTRIRFDQDHRGPGIVIRRAARIPHRRPQEGASEPESGRGNSSGLFVFGHAKAAIRSVDLAEKTRSGRAAHTGSPARPGHVRGQRDTAAAPHQHHWPRSGPPPVGAARARAGPPGARYAALERSAGTSSGGTPLPSSLTR